MQHQGRDAQRLSILEMPKQRLAGRCFGIFAFLVSVSVNRLKALISTSLRRKAILVIAFLLVPCGVLISAFNRSTAYAAPSSYLNFQARLLTNTGNLVPDGLYNIEFKLYNASSSSGSSQGSCSGDAACEWTETRTGGNTVSVTNGYFSVNLGSVTAFGSSIDWSSQQWLTMRIGGIGSPTWDTEMTPRIILTAVPLAFVANNVASGNTTTSSTNSSNVSVTTGNATGSTSNSGNISLDTGTATGTAGTISLGATNASSLILGRSGLTTTNTGDFAVQGGTLTVGTTSQAGSLAISDGSSNNVTILVQSTSGNFNATIPTLGSNDTFCFVTLNNCTGAGATSVGTIDTGTYSANGGSISAGTLYLQSATGTHVGLVTTSSQTFGGDKTFNGELTVGATTSGIGLQDALGTSQYNFGSYAAGRWELAVGTGSTPITAAGPSFKISKTEDISSGTCVNQVDNECNAALAVEAVTSSTTSYMQLNAIYAGARGNSTTAGSDVVALDAVGRVYGSGVGIGTGAYLEGRRDTTTARALGAEIRVNNQTASDCSYINTGFSNCVGAWITSAGSSGSDNALGLGFGAISSSQFITGIAFNTNSILTTSIDDASSSATSIHIGGTHATAAISVAAGSGNVGIGTTSPSQLLEVSAVSSIATNLFKVSGISSATRGVVINPTVTNSSSNGGLEISPVISPTGAITTTYGTINLATYSNSSSNITNAYANYLRLDTSASYSGTLSNGYELFLESPTFSGSKPGVQYGLRVQNQGVSGVTTAYGLYVATQSGATNNYAAAFQGGNVGIGTITPSDLLEVNGIIRVDTLGASTSAVGLCRNSSNQISSCSGANGTDIATTLQNTYANGNTLTTTDARSLTVTLADTTTDSSFIVNEQCTTCSASGGRFAVQSSGTDVFTVSPNGGNISIGTGGFANTIQIGTTSGAVTQTINIGNNNTASSTSNIVIGSTVAGSINLVGAPINLNTGANNGNVNIANGTGTGTIGIGNSASGQISLLSGANIVLGTSDTTGTLLVLDTKTGSGDPTGVNGGIYYNSNASKFRCYENSAWADCISSGATSVGTLDTATTNAQGGHITAGVLYLQSATITLPGLVNNTTQSFSGDKTFTGTISSPGAGTSSERFGSGSAAAGNNTVSLGNGSSASANDSVVIGTSATSAQASSTVVGKSATVTGSSSVAVGNSSSAGTGAVALGSSAVANGGVAIGLSTTATGGVAVGAGANSASSDSVAVGASTSTTSLSVALGYSASAGFLGSVALGGNATTTAQHQLVVGGSTSSSGYITSAYLGSGVTDATPQNFILQGTGSSVAGTAGAAFTLKGGAGTTTGAGSIGGALTLQAGDSGGANIAGGAVNVNGGRGTGTGVGGNIVFQYAPAGGSGSSLNALQTACQISGTDGSLSCPGSNTNSERFGAGTVASSSYSLAVGNGASVTGGNNSVAIGNGANVNSNRGTAVGYNASTGLDGDAFGQGSSAGANAQAFGSGATAANYGIAIGDSAASTGGGIAIGLSASASSGQLVVTNVTSGFFGNGVTNASPSSFTLQGTGSSAAGTAGADFTLQGGAGATSSTGSAGGGLNLYGADAGGSGANNGGSVNIKGGAKTSSGTVGAVNINASTNGVTNINTGSSTAAVNIGNAAAGQISLQSGANIVVGTSDTTGTLLVLDTKTGSGDPTGVNGGIYYNSNANKFRCYENSTWVDCIGSGGSGITSIGAIDTVPTQANGARISGTALILQYGDGTYPGLVSTTTQTIAGAKTFTSLVTGSAGLAVSGTAPNSANGAVGAFTNTLSSTTNDQAGIRSASTVTLGGASTQTYSSIQAYIMSTEATNLGSGTIIGLNGSAEYNSTGGLGTAIAGRFQVINTSSGTLSSGFGLQILNASKPLGIITKNVGISIQDQTVGANNTNLLIGASAAVTGNFSIYNSSTYDNIFAGNLRVGSTSAPTVALDVTGAGQFSGNLNVNGNTTLGDANTDTITFTGRVNSDILPLTDDTYNLGDNTHRWANIFLGGETIHLGTSTSDEAALSYVTATDSLVVKNATNSSTALQIQNSSGLSLINVDTTAYVNATNNLIATNPSFESAISSPWVAKGSTPTTFAQDSTQSYNGVSSLKVTTQATADQGAKYNITLLANTTYNVTFYILLDNTSNAFATMQAGYSPDGTNDTNTCNQSTTTVLPGQWTKVVCTFTVGGSVIGTPYFFIKQTDAVVHTFYIDGVTLFKETAATTNASNNYADGRVAINGVVNSALVVQNTTNSTNALSVQNASGASIFNIDTTDGGNLISNPGAEVNTTGWAVEGNAGGSISRDVSQSWLGNGSLKVVATNTANQGAHFTTGNTLPTKLLPSTTYAMSWYSKLSSGTLNDIKGRYSVDGGTTFIDCTPTNQSVVTTGWTRYTCSFSTAGTAPSSTAYIAIVQTAASGVHTFWVDGLQVEAAASSSEYSAGKLYLNATVVSPMTLRNSGDSTEAFKILNASGSSLLNVDTLNSTVSLASTSTASSLFTLTNNSATGNTVASLQADALTTGKGLSVTSASANLTGNLLNVSSASTSNFGTTAATSGGITLALTGAHTGYGVQISDATTGGTALQVNANAVTNGNAVVISSTATGLTGNALQVVTSSTATTTNGLVYFNFQGNRVAAAPGFLVNDALTTLATAAQIKVDSVTTGLGLTISSASTGITSAGSNTGSLLNIQASGANNSFTGSLAAINFAGNNSGDTGALLNLNSSGANQLSQSIFVTNASTGTSTNGLVRFNFSGARTAAGSGFLIDDASTTLATTFVQNSNSLTSGIGHALNVNALTTGKALTIARTGTGLTTAGANIGSLLDLQTGVETAFTGSLASINFAGTVVGNTGALLNLNSSGAAQITQSILATNATTGTTTNGIVHFNFTGARTTAGSGLLIDDISTTLATTAKINANSLTTGNALVVSATASGLTGNALLVSTTSTGTVSAGLEHFNNTGVRTTAGVGFLIDDASTTLATAAQINANSLTTGLGLTVSNTGTGITTAGANTGSLLNVQASGATAAFTGSLATINFAGTAVANTGALLNLNSSGAAQITQSILATNASTGTTPNGLIHFNFTGARTTAGSGLLIDDISTTLASTFILNANSLTSGTGQAINVNSLTSGTGLSVINTGANLTGNLFLAQSGSTTVASNGLVRLNFTGSHTGNGLQVDDVTTTGTAAQINVNSLTSGIGLTIGNTGTGITTAGANIGSLLNVQASGATAGFTGSLANINFAGNNVADTGALLNLNSSGASQITQSILATNASTGATASGLVHFNFTGVRTAAGSGLLIDDVSTTLATTVLVNANSLTTGVGQAINVNALTSGTGLSVTNTGTALTGNLFLAASGSTSAASNGLARFNFSGAHTGNGVQVDDVTTAGNAVQINANSVVGGNGLAISTGSAATTGSALNVTGRTTITPTLTVASGAAAVLNGFSIPATTATLTGTTTVATTTGFNLFNIAAPTITDSSSVTVTNAATAYIGGAPIQGGSATITNPYALWIDSGVSRFDGRVEFGQASTTAGLARFLNSSNANTVDLQAGTTGTSYALTLPTTSGSSGDCLQNTATPGILTFAACAAGGSGVTTVGAIDTTPTAANGARISGSSIFMQYGDGTYPGLVSTTTQTIAGAKTFTSGLTVSAASSLTLGQGSTSTGSIIFNNGTNNNTATIQSGVTSSSYSLTLPTTAGSASDCLQNTGTPGVLTFGSCGAGGSSTLQQAYTASAGAAPSILLSNTFGGITIRDASSSTITDLFTITNNANNRTWFDVTATGILLQNSSGNSGLQYDNTSAGTLKVFGSAGSGYASISYVDGTSTAVFAASTGTTQIGSGSGGSVTITLANAADQLNVGKTLSAAAGYSTNDYNFTRTVTGTTFNLSGSVLKVDDQSTETSGTNSANVLWVNQATAGTGNLILAQTGGSTDIFKVSAAGVVTVKSGGSYTGAGALTLSSGGATALTVDTGGAAALNIGNANATSVVIGGNTAATVTVNVANSSTSAFILQTAAGTDLIAADTTNNKITIGTSDSTGTILILDTKTTSTEPTGVNGAIYYNAGGNGGAGSNVATYAGKFRCFEGNLWKNCIGMRDISERRWGYTTPTTTTATTFTGFGNMAAIGPVDSCTAAANGQAESNYIQCTSSTTSLPKGGGFLVSTSTEARWLPKFVTRIRTDANVTTNGRMWVGLSSASLTAVTVPTTATANATVILGIGYETGVNSGNFVCGSGDATNISGTDMGVAPAASTYYDVIIDYSTSGTLVCSIAASGGAYTTVTKTSNTPTNATAIGPYIAEILKSGTPAHVLSVSYAYIDSN